MASEDNLHDVIETLRREMPDIPADVWERLAALASFHFGARRIYFPAQKKRRHLEAIAAADAAANAEHLASVLGVSVRHARRLRALLD